MSIYNRTTLKNLFKNGSNPTEVHFSDLIDSTINKIDDGFAKSVDDGLQLSPLGTSKKLVSFYDNVRDTKPNWQISINPKEDAPGLGITDGDGHNRLFIKSTGQVGVNTLYPRATLDVGGTIGAVSRVGGHNKNNKIPADGKWHTIIDKLSGCHAFEIVAKVAGKPKSGKYAIAHAIAVSAYGHPNSKINVTQSWYGSFWDKFWKKIKFRWVSSAAGYRLEMQTGGHYGLDDKGRPFPVRYHICKLWDDNFLR